MKQEITLVYSFKETPSSCKQPSTPVPKRLLKPKHTLKPKRADLLPNALQATLQIPQQVPTLIHPHHLHRRKNTNIQRSIACCDFDVNGVLVTY
jgi:hypothetical protein